MAIFTLLLILCAYGIDVTIYVIEEVNAGRNGPPYDYIANLINLPENSALIDLMENAELYGNFTYDATVADPCGYYINGINSIIASSTMYWQILGGDDLSPLNLGGRTSNYYPRNGEKLLFRLVTWEEYGLKKNVTITVREDVNSGTSSVHYDNVLFVANIAVNATLIDVMEKAKADGKFSSDATISESYILDGDDISGTPVDASCYVPHNEENVVLRFETQEEYIVMQSFEHENKGAVRVKVIHTLIIVGLLVTFAAIVAAIIVVIKPKSRNRAIV